MASYSTLKTEIIYGLGNRSDLDARIPNWLNWAYYEILMTPRFSFYELDKQVTTQTINTLRAYDLPDDCWFILSVRDDTNERKLDRKHWQVFDKIAHTPGQPNRYAHFANTIELDPTPDDEYDIILRYRKRPIEIVSDSSPIIGAEWDEVLVRLTIVKGLESLEQPEKATKQRQLLEAALSLRLDVPQLEDADAETTLGVRFE